MSSLFPLGAAEVEKLEKQTQDGMARPPIVVPVEPEDKDNKLWLNHDYLPEWYQRGNIRFVLSSFDNMDAMGFNVCRRQVTYVNFTKPEDAEWAQMTERLLREGVHSMEYISPTDCFSDDSLLKISPRMNPFYINLFKNFPILEHSVILKKDGSKLVVYNNPNDRGGNAHRMVGCRNNPIWQKHYDRWVTYMLSGNGAVAEDPLYARLPDRGANHGLTRAMYIDNAGPISLCYCDVCKKDFEKFLEERKAHGMAEGVAMKEFPERICFNFDKSMTDLCHKFGVPTMGCQFNYFSEGEADCIPLERIYRHAPWERLAPLYKVALAAGRGRPVIGIGYNTPPTDLSPFSMPEVTPDFTRMAMAEGLATQGDFVPYGVETEDDEYSSLVKQYNQFNASNQSLYHHAQPGGRIAILFSFRSCLLGRPGYNGVTIYDASNQLMKRLMGAGLPVEVISEENLTPKLRDHFSTIIAPAFSCVTEEQIANLALFHEQEGSLIISKDFGSRDWTTKEVENKTARDLIAKAESKDRGLRLMEDNGDKMRPEEIVAMLSEVGDGGFQQRLVIKGAAPTDFMINALRHPEQDMESYHIVNYNYSMNPVCLLQDPSQSAAWEFVASNHDALAKQKLYIFGKALPEPLKPGANPISAPAPNDGFALEVVLNGEPVTTLTADKLSNFYRHEGFPVTLPCWIEVDLSGKTLKAINQVVLRPKAAGKGRFALYIDPSGRYWSGYKASGNTGEWSQDLSPDFKGIQAGSYTMVIDSEKPAASPLKTSPIRLHNAELKLQGYEKGWQAAVMSPDDRAEILPIEYSGSEMTIKVPDVEIYSIIVLGRDESKLEALVKRNNELGSSLSAVEANSAVQIKR